MTFLDKLFVINIKMYELNMLLEYNLLLLYKLLHDFLNIAWVITQSVLVYHLVTLHLGI